MAGTAIKRCGHREDAIYFWASRRRRTGTTRGAAFATAGLALGVLGFLLTALVVFVF